MPRARHFISSKNSGFDGSYPSSSFLLIPSYIFYMLIEQSNTSKLNQQWDTVIMFWVSVPVLSEQIQVVDPKVSIDSRFLTKTFFLAIYLAVRASWIVTAATTPSGTFATSTPIAIMKLVKASYPQINPRIKNAIASVKAI